MSIILHTHTALTVSPIQETVDPRAPKLLIPFCTLLASRGLRIAYGTLGALFPSGRHQPGQRGAYLIHMVPTEIQWVACQKAGGYDTKAYEDWDLKLEYLEAQILSLLQAERVLLALEEILG